MSNLLHLQIKLCRKVLGNSYNPNLLLKVSLSPPPTRITAWFQKHVYFTPPAASYVNKSHRKSTTIHLTEDATKVFPEKPAVAPAWRPTPSTDRTNIVQHYLKLSKIRLTSKYPRVTPAVIDLSQLSSWSPRWRDTPWRPLRSCGTPSPCASPGPVSSRRPPTPSINSTRSRSTLRCRAPSTEY